jgi:tetraacyldisaccharide 4'-kinase
MLQQKLKDIPVIVDTDRRRGARRAVEEFGVDTVILDDGFQQWGIAKDLEIVAIDATNPFGNRHMLPRGILRQPLSTLRDAGIFVLTKTNLSAETAETLRFLSQCNPAALIVETAHQPAGFFRLDARDTLLSVDALAGKRALLVSGIADPLSFEQLMHNLNIEVAGHLVFADHHRYTSDDWVRVSTQCSQRGAGVVVTTEKDAVRLEKIARASSGTQVMVLRIELVLVKDAHGFNSRLRRIYNV